MKKVLILFACVSMVACARQNALVAYDFPAAMSAPVKAQYQEMCNKGAALYQKNCAACHSIRVKGRTIIPDFTQEKMNGYAIRVANRVHEANMPDSIVSVEDLGLISTFFQYKRKNKIR